MRISFICIFIRMFMLAMVRRIVWWWTHEIWIHENDFSCARVNQTTKRSNQQMNKSMCIVVCLSNRVAALQWLARIYRQSYSSFHYHYHYSLAFVAHEPARSAKWCWAETTPLSLCHALMSFNFVQLSSCLHALVHCQKKNPKKMKKKKRRVENESKIRVGFIYET